MRKLKYFLLMTLTLPLFFGCQIEDDFEINNAKLVDFDLSDADGQTLLLFVLDEAGFKGSVPLNLASPSGAEVSVNIEVIDTVYDDANEAAVQGLHYDNLTNSVSISSGELQANVEFDALFSGFSTPNEKVELNIRISSASGGQVFENDTVSFVMQRYTPLNINDFVGTYDITSSSLFDGTPYAYSVTTAVNGTGDGLIVTSLGSAEVGAIGRTLDGPVEMIFTDVPGSAEIAIIAQSMQPTTTACGSTETILLTDLGGGTFNAAEATFSVAYGLQVSCGFFEAVSATAVKQ